MISIKEIRKKREEAGQWLTPVRGIRVFAFLFFLFLIIENLGILIGDYHKFILMPVGDALKELLKNWRNILINSASLTFGWFGYLSYRDDKKNKLLPFKTLCNIHDFLCEANSIVENLLTKARDSEGGLDADNPTKADLVAILWLPYYGITSELSDVAKKFHDNLRAISIARCKVIMVLPNDPIRMISTLLGGIDDGFFTCQRFRHLARSEHNDLIIQAIMDKKTNKWRNTIDEKGLDEELRKDKKFYEFLHHLNHIYTNSDLDKYNVVMVPNDMLENFHVQMIWSNEKVVAIFEQSKLRRGKKDYETSEHGYEVCGFVTESADFVKNFYSMALGLSPLIRDKAEPMYRLKTVQQI